MRREVSLYFKQCQIYDDRGTIWFKVLNNISLFTGIFYSFKKKLGIFSENDNRKNI